jgi:hypothetical protein
MKDKEISYIRVLFYSLFIFCITIAYDEILNDYLPPIKFLNFVYINMGLDDIRSFLFTVWQVQTSVSVLSITFVTIVLTRVEHKILGMTVTEVLLLRKKRLLLNYWEKVLLSIVIVIMNMFFVSHEKLGASTLLFLINGGIILSLLVESLRIIIDPESQYQKVVKFLEKNIDEIVERENNRQEGGE